MGCRIIEGHEAGSDHCVCVLYCSTGEWAFGPTFGSIDEAEAFIRFCEPRDPRSYADRELRQMADKFRARTVVVACDQCGVDFTTPGEVLDRCDREAQCPCGAVVTVPPESEVIAKESLVA